MMLIKLRDYLKEKHVASLSDVARHFDIPESATQSMLEHWVRKGQVTVGQVTAEQVTDGHATVDADASCGSGCGSCSFNKNSNRCEGASMVYRWQESGIRD